MKKKEKQTGKRKQRLQRELEAVEKTYGDTLDWLERGELRSWVKAGNSPFANPEQIIHEDGTPLGFIEWHRSARWAMATEPFEAGPPSRGLFDFFTDRRADRGSLEETRKFLRDTQAFLGCEILTLMNFLKEKGLLYEYLRYKDPAYQTGEEKLPF